MINRIRSINEELTNNLKEKVGHVFIYADLIKEYGWDFKLKATADEMANSRDKFRRDGFDDYEHTIERIFKKMKFHALHLLITRYMELMKSNKTESENERIFNVFEFLLRNRNKLAAELGIVVVSLS